MAYSQQVWNNGPNSGTPLNATRLNKMEAGIGAAATAADNANTGLTTTAAALTDSLNAFKATVGTPTGPASNGAPVARFRSTAAIDLPRNTWKFATWDQRAVDSHAQYAAANPSRWTCKVKGIYFFDSVVYINAWNNNNCYTCLYKNGAESDATWRSTLSLGPPTTVTTSAMFDLVVGDYIEVGANHDATTDATGYRKLYGAVLNAFMVRAT